MVELLRQFSAKSSSHRIITDNLLSINLMGKFSLSLAFAVGKIVVLNLEGYSFGASEFSQPIVSIGL